MMRRILLTLSLLALLALGVAAQSPATIEGGDEAQLRALLARYFGSYDAMSSSTVYVGSLPPTLGVEVPLPANGRLLGSVQRVPLMSQGPFPAPTFTDVYVDVPATSGETLAAFLKEALTAQGWTEISASSSGSGGFLPPSTNFYNSYCNADQSIALTWSNNTNAAGDSSATITLQTPADSYQCTVYDPAQPYFDINRLVPPLTMPEGVSFFQSNVGGMGGGGGMGGMGMATYSSATLQTALPLSTMYAAYAEQLVAAGWTLEAETVADIAAYSTWTLPEADGRQWVGSLSFVRSPQLSDGYYALLSVEERVNF